MENQSWNVLTLISLVYLCVAVHPVLAGKCSGRWAIHACFGGNGKRSDRTLNGMDEKQPSNTLRRYLLKGSYQPNTFMNIQFDAQNSVLGDSQKYKNIHTANPRKIKRLLSLLQMLRLERKMRHEMDGH